MSTTILVVDDDPSLVRLVCRRMSRDGFRVLTAGNGEEGLRLAVEQRPDLVLLDIVLPGLSGREVCARLKAEPATRAIPVMFLTGLGAAQQVQDGLALGAADYLVKPLDLGVLKERIMVCLARTN